MPDAIRNLALSGYAAITGISDTVYQGTNTFEGFLNYARAWSGLFNTAVRFPGTYKEVTGDEAAPLFQELSGRVAPIAATAEEGKIFLNWFELYNRVSKLKELSNPDKYNAIKALALLAQIIQKFIEAIFLEPTGKKWKWYTLQDIARFTHIEASRTTLKIVKETCVFVAAGLSLINTRNERAEKQAKLDRKVTSLNELTGSRERNQFTVPTKKVVGTDGTVTYVAKTPAELAQMLAATRGNANAAKAKRANLQAILENQDPVAKRAAFYTAALDEIKKDKVAVIAGVGTLQAYYNRLIAWGQNLALAAERQRLQEAQKQPGTAEEMEEIDKILQGKISKQDAETLKFSQKANRQSWWYSTNADSVTLKIKNELRTKKIEKKDAKIANLKLDLQKCNRATEFDFTKLFIAPISIAIILKDETKGLLADYLKQPRIAAFLTAALFVNVFAISIAGLNRTQLMAKKEAQGLPTPIPLEPNPAAVGA